MTQYTSILHATLFLNVLALLYRSQWFHSSSKANKSGDTGHDRIKNGDNTTVEASPTSVLERNEKDDDDDDDNKHDKAMKHRHATPLYRIFLPVYLLATAADWLQGPYKYAVYSAYGYSQKDISILFVAGFGSGMSLGSIVGGMADTYGRKRMALVYCVVYTFSCLAKHFRPFVLLLLGRVLGGIATSLLFSVFDAWLIQAHDLRSIDKSVFLSQSFAASNFGSSVVAIVAGLLANAMVGTTADAGETSTLRPAFLSAAQRWFVEEADADVIGPPTDVHDPRWNAAWVYKGGGIVAFDLAVIPLALCFLLVLAFWDENYGQPQKHNSDDDDDQHGAIMKDDSNSKGYDNHRKRPGMLSGMQRACVTIWRSPAIFCLCAVTSFFEGAMYVFILLWTPALRALDVHPEDDQYPGPPLGVVFATFMVCCMLGTSIFAILSSRGVPPSQILIVVLALSSISCLVISITSSDTMAYCAMLLFEGCIGAYYPAMSTAKGNIVPEDQRAAIYSVFRLPMNLVVLINLCSNLEFSQAFGLCFAMLGLATFLQIRIVKVENSKTTHAYGSLPSSPTSSKELVTIDSC